ncbi:hypothetical protein ARMA_0731 [Ardenticatena maritima]|uniref:Uncharacterized protein n=1 Tax=Ardenticatena maritima TaxID=872965 RepID=A0A0N0RFC7_9CHLR|nr:hypothetical protein ARMA_0731 [Ardenticatena maritima]
MYGGGLRIKRKKPALCGLQRQRIPCGSNTAESAFQIMPRETGFPFQYPLRIEYG